MTRFRVELRSSTEADWTPVGDWTEDREKVGQIMAGCLQGWMNTSEARIDMEKALKFFLTVARVVVQESENSEIKPLDTQLIKMDDDMEIPSSKPVLH